MKRLPSKGAHLYLSLLYVSRKELSEAQSHPRAHLTSAFIFASSAGGLLVGIIYSLDRLHKSNLADLSSLLFCNI